MSMPVTDLPSTGNAVVPMDDRGNAINESEYRRLLRYMAEGGTNIAVGGRHATEFANMNRTERLRLWEVSAEELSGSAQLNAIPIGPASTDEMVSMFRTAKDMGFDAGQLYPGAAGGRGDDGLFLAEVERYFRDILEAVEMPMYLNAYSGGEIIDGPNKRLPLELLLTLVDDYPHLIGVTVMGDDMPALKSFLTALDGRRPVRVTGGEVCFNMLELGVYGFHSIQPCFAPRLCSTMVAAYHSGDKVRAKELSEVVAELCHIVHTPHYHYPRSIKPVLNHLGFDAGAIRRPYLSLSAELQHEIARRIDELDLGRFEALPAPA
jgi:dihydrodipicolinate synthase/N-acetylneuraminate lyase